MPDGSNNALGEFLRSRRQKLAPETVGLASSHRRRAAGLRREEVAERAGIGVDWYIRLEQGRSARPSPTTVDALARALLLNGTEHAHLRTLARDASSHPFLRETVPDSLRYLVENLNQPAYVTGRRWDILIWNEAAADLFPAFARLGDADRNVLLYVFTDPEARALFADGWQQEARRILARFRTTHDLWADAPSFISLVERLRSSSPEFSDWWVAHDIDAVVSGEKVLHHPVRGARRFAYASFQANDDPALKLAIYTER